jgi:5-formyltetrahydrofolate cyclo-ligase
MKRRALLSPAQIGLYSAAITAQVCSMPAFSASQTVMAYIALPQEVQTADLIEYARRHHKRVVVPVVTAQGLLAVECPSQPRDFRRGAYGILEPRDRSAIVPPAEIAWVLVPGVGFDPEGNRLGYGAGYYDRFLNELPATAVYGGIAFHLQMVSHIPSLSHDVPMQFVVTEQGWQSCAPVHLTRLTPDRLRQDKGEHR